MEVGVREANGAGVVDIDVPNREQRIAQILTDPEAYFAAARAMAWTLARAEVAADLAERARQRGARHAHDSANG